MKNLKLMLSTSLLIGAAVVCRAENEGVASEPARDKFEVKVENSDFNKTIFTSSKKMDWRRENFHNGEKAIVSWEKKGGKDGRGCVKIEVPEANGRAAVGVTQHLTGLEPDGMYRFKVDVKTVEVKEGRGAVIFDKSTRQYWNASQFLYGTNDWQEVYIDFYADAKGEASIVCALGYRLGGTTNGGFATGTAYYDNVSVTKLSSSNACYVTGKYMTLLADQDQASLEVANERLSGLDKIYEALVELVGVKPHGDSKLVAMGTPGLEAGYWALAGNPILIKHRSFGGVVNAKNDIGFGIVHEMGHVFNAGKQFEGMNFTSKWNWNDELFANFRAYYAIASTNSPCSFNGHTFQGEELKNFYKSSYPTGKKTCYDNTFGAGKPTASGDPYTYIFIRLGDTLGWDAIKGMLREAYREGKGPFKNNWERFDYLMTTLQKHTDKDVRATFPEGELELIKEGLGGNK